MTGVSSTDEARTMYLKLKRVLDQLLPGRIDGWVLNSAIAACAIWVAAVSAEFAFSLDGGHTVVLVAFICISLQCLVDIWVILGDAQMRSRFTFGLLASLAPAVILGMIASEFDPSGEVSKAWLISLILVHRLLVVSVCAFIGLGVQSLFLWRIFLQSQPSDRPRKQTIGIKHFALLTTLLAFSIASFRALYHSAASELAWSGYLALSIGELLLTIALLLIPILISFSARFLRRYFLLIQLLIATAIVGFVHYESRKDTAAVPIVCLAAFFSIWIVGISFASRWGYVLGHLRREEIWETNRSGVESRMIGWYLAVLTVLATLGLQTTISTSAFLAAVNCNNKEVTLKRSWKFARTAKKIDRLTGVMPSAEDYSGQGGGLPALLWNPPHDSDSSLASHEFNAFLVWGNLRVENPANPLKLLKACSNLELPDITIATSSIGKPFFDQFDKHPELDLVRLEWDTIDEAAFDAFCRRTNASMLILNSRPSVEMLRSVTRMRSLNGLYLRENAPSRRQSSCALPLPEFAETLSVLPVKNCMVSYDDSSNVDLNCFNQLRSLWVDSSKIDSVFVEKVNDLESKGTLTTIELYACQLDDESVRALAKLQVSNVCIHEETATLASLEFEPLYENKTPTDVSIRDLETGDRRLLKRAGKKQP